MYQVDDEPIETIHLYVVKEGDKRPSWLPVIISLVTLSILIAIGVCIPYAQPVTRASIRVPAVPLGVKTFTISSPVIPTGIKIYPATTAHGWLTFTNGSIIGQSVPVGYVLGNIVTDRAVFVPPGSADGYGYARVSAHSLLSGKQGNIPALAINSVVGSSLYIRNLSAFSGGRDGYSVKYVTEHDKQTAIMQARNQLTTMVTGLHYPCSETLSGADTKMAITWRCQFVTYRVPSYMHVLQVCLSGKNLLVDVTFTPPPVRVWVK